VNVESAANRDEAHEIIAKQRAEGIALDVVLLDQELDGAAELVSRVRSLAEQSPKIVLLVALGRAEDQVLADAAIAKPVRSDELADCLAKLFSGEHGPRPASIAPRVSRRPPALVAETGAPANARILVAEDNAVNAELLLEVLRSLGYGAEVVVSGREAVEASQRGTYDLILMDCQMPDMDGHQATREIRAHEASARRTPIVAVTAHAFEEEKQRALESGMDDYLTKPVSFTALAEVVRRYLGPNVASEPEHLLAQEAAALDPSVSRSAKVARLFLTHAPVQVDKVARLARGETEGTLREAAHKLKGSCLAIGAGPMAELCKKLESSPRESAELSDRLEREFSRVRAALERELEAKA
jgi:CheY-like chemotaxis protein